MNNQKPLNVLVSSLVFGACALLSFGCGSSAAPRPPEVQTTVIAEEGVPGGIIQITTEVSARVSSINYKTRNVTLLGADGTSETIAVGPEAVNFDQIKSGDLVVGTMTERLIVVVFDANMEVAQGEVALVALSEKNAPPGGVIADVTQLRGKVTLIDTQARTATVQFDGGASRVINVRDDIDLTKCHVGDQVLIRQTRIATIRVEKTTPK